MISGPDALSRLRAGNERHVSDMRRSKGVPHWSRLGESQEPFAVVLGCSDSRVPPEIVFDQGLGDLFVIRVAGNIVAPSQVGSVEFAAERLGTRLVVVLGHTRCGAVTATLEALRDSTGAMSPNLRSIADRIRPAVEPTLRGRWVDDFDGAVDRAVRANVRSSVHRLRKGSAVLDGLAGSGELIVMGAEYSLDTGVVEFLGET
jgi:carbonic anhydrase